MEATNHLGFVSHILLFSPRFVTALGSEEFFPYPLLPGPFEPSEPPVRQGPEICDESKRRALWRF